LYDSVTDQVTMVDKLPAGEDVRKYFLLHGYGYEANELGVRLFAHDLENSAHELMNNKILTFDYLYTFNHYIAVTAFLKRVHTKKKVIFNSTQQSVTEYKWSQKCNNGPIIYCKKDQGINECFGYDYSLNHPSIMSRESYKIPIREGKEYFLDGLPDELEFGYYHVEITCDDENFNKIFRYSAHNVYTHQSLDFAIEHMEQFNVNIALFDNDEPNAYLYDKADLVSGSEPFGKWYEIIVKLKKAFPKNVLIKWLASTLHGQLTSANNISKSNKQMEEEGLYDKCDIVESDQFDYTIVDYIDYGTHQRYELLSNKSPYKHNYRLKSFLWSECRNKIAKIALVDIDNVIRIHTDNCTFINVDPKLKIPTLKLENKSSGRLEWINANKCINH
jgi:hypothetical protein